MKDCQHTDYVMVVRPHERKAEWGSLQVFECRDCGRRWSE